VENERSGLALPGRCDSLGDVAGPLPEILFEDDFLLAIDKPCGLPVVAERRRGESLVDLVRGRFGHQVSNVHRLDAEASGIVLFARTKLSLDFLSGQFQSKTVRKVHVALVAVLGPERVATGAPARDASGALPPEFTVDLALGDDAERPGLMRVTRGRTGKPSATDFRVLEAFGRFAWVECRPLTGRAHQVRVHMAAAGAPVLNDAAYGEPGAALLLSGLKRDYKGIEEERPLISRLALHASALGFTHPGSREAMEITAPLPREFEVPLKYLRKFAGPRAGRGKR
jgi:23S rRNA pseudouridine1911/1915/1917 synthase